MNQSMVSFCALQLEIEDQLSNTAPDIEFNCNRTLEGLFRDLEISNPVARIKPCRPDPENYRGTRQMSKIKIETYSNFKAGMSEIKGEKEKSSNNCSKVNIKSIIAKFTDIKHLVAIRIFSISKHHYDCTLGSISFNPSRSGWRFK